MKKKSYQHSLLRGIQRGAFFTVLSSMLLVPHFAESSNDASERVRQELISIQSKCNDTLLAYILLQHYDKQMEAAMERLSDEEFSDEKATLQYRRDSLKQSNETWKDFTSELLQWGRLRGGVGKLSAPLTGDALDSNLIAFDQALFLQRALEVCICCESMLSGDEYNFLKAYDPDSTTATMMKYADATWKQDDINLSDHSVMEHYSQQLREAYAQRIARISASSHPKKEALIQVIGTAQQYFFAYAESCYDIGMNQPFRAAKYMAAENMSRVIIWHLRDLDRYFPL